MSELPSSWGLSKRLNGAGHLELWGKDDTGREYKARECPTRELTDGDVRALRECDRESTTAAEYVEGVVRDGQKFRDAQERSFEDELVEAAGPVVRAGLERVTLGYSRRYARNYDRVFGGK